MTKVVTQSGPGGLRAIETPLAIYREATTQVPLIFDATLEYPIERSAQVTRFPVETGADISDHAVRSAPSLSFRAVIVNEPTDSEAARQRSNAMQHDPTDPRRTFDTGITLGPQVQQDRAISILDDLIFIFESGVPVYNIFTTNESIGDAVLTSFTHREIGLGAIEVSGRFESIVVASATRTVPIPSAGVNNQAANNKDLGTKATKTVDAETARKSVAAGIFDWAFGG